MPSLQNSFEKSQESITTAFTYALKSDDLVMRDEVATYAMDIAQLSPEDTYYLHLDAVEREEEINGEDI